jgi:hypothetical protein
LRASSEGVSPKDGANNIAGKPAPTTFRDSPSLKGS